MSKQGLSVRLEAEQIGRSPSTVFRHRYVPYNLPGQRLTTVLGRDGKQYPAHRRFNLAKRDQLIFERYQAGETLVQIVESTGWSLGTVAAAVRKLRPGGWKRPKTAE